MRAGLAGDRLPGAAGPAAPDGAAGGRRTRSFALRHGRLDRLHGRHLGRRRPHDL